MKRDLETLQNTQFDLLVIGAGIQGAAICYKAAQRGLKVLLLEKNDFCGASSGNSLKILHGGLRYLQTLDFKRMRDSIRSRRELMQLAPHLVEPLPCVMPAYGHGLKGKEVMGLAMALNDLISMDRNKDLAQDKHLPAGYTINKAQCLVQVPGISEQGLHGASVWYDALAINTERLALEYILQAADLGADCFNYLGVTGLSMHASGHIQAQLLDSLSGRPYQVRAEYVINSAGAAYEDLIPGSALKPAAVRWVRGLNIVVRKKLLPGGAVALEKQLGEHKRMLFMVPWRGKYTMIGTHYIEKPRRDALFPVEKKDIMALVHEINALYPPAQLTFDDVSYYHAGLLPMHGSAKSGDPSQPVLSKSSTIFYHGKDHGKDHAKGQGQQHGFNNFYSIKGIKYTTAPQVADRILDRIVGRVASNSLKKEEKQTRTQTLESGHSLLTQNDALPDDYLLQKYADRASTVQTYLGTAGPQWLDSEHSLLRGEVIYFIEEEMACHLSDVIFRRCAVGTAECPPLKVLQSINQIMADHFKWSDEQQSAELEQVLQRYAPLNLFH